MRSLLLLLTLLVSGCAQQPSNNPNSHYGSYPWWYDDYLYYWDHYYPWCCNGAGDIEWLINDWWHSLDDSQQQAIKDKFADWQGSHQQPDIGALKGEFNQRWQQLTPQQQQNLRARREELDQLPRPPAGGEHPQRPEQRPSERPSSKPALPATRPAQRPAIPATLPATRPAHFPQRPMVRPGRLRG